MGQVGIGPNVQPKLWIRIAWVRRTVKFHALMIFLIVQKA